MAKASLNDFWKGRRPRISLNGISLLQNSSGDSRIKLDCSIALAGKNLTGCGPIVTQMLESVGKDDSPLDFGGSKKMRLEGVQVRFYVDDQKKTPQIKINSGTLNKFKVVASEGASGSSDVVLSFSVYSNASKPLWDWAYELHHGECFVEFEAGQMKLGDPPKEEGEGEQLQPALIEGATSTKIKPN